MRSVHRRWPRAARALLVGAAVASLVGGIVSMPAAADAASVSRAATLPGWLHTSGATIRASSGKAYTIKATAWFGMETERCAPDGLWAISLDQGLATIASMGFNTIRLPFSNECLARSSATSTSSIGATLNPQLVALTPLQLIDVIVARARLYGLNIILDRHRITSAAQSALWYSGEFTEKRWIADWKRLAKRYASARNVIGFDLHNEPHGAACWGCGEAALDWRAAATRAGNAVLKVNPHVLIIVEGIDKQAKAGYYWWGGSLASVSKKPVTLKVAHRVVYSPHDYPSTVYPQAWFHARNYPKNLPAVWNKNWGYIDKKKIAPILLGEFGTKLETRSDKLWLKTIVTYLKKNRISFSYWSFNPDSGDTGGLVKDDWTTKQAAKLRYLKPLIGAGRTVPVITAPIVVPTSKPATSAPGSSTLSATWQLQSSYTGGYVANLAVTSAKTVDGWTATWPDTTATSIASSWGMTCSLTPGVSITCSGQDWGAHVAEGYVVTVGMEVKAETVPAAPTVTITH